MIRVRTFLHLGITTLALATISSGTTVCSQSRSQSAPPAQTSQSSDLKTINNPGGGQVLYGSLPAQSFQSAMGFMLRQVHGHFGDRPQVGKFLQTKDGTSVAAFFNLNAKMQGGATKPLSGMVIVAIPRSGAQPMAAVLYDDAAHFPKTQPVMLNALNQAWRKESAEYSASQPASAGATPAPQTLRQTTGGDRSASIGLPPGWKITNVAGGYLRVEGPNGELMDIAGMFQQIHDPRGGQSLYGGSRGPMLVAPMDGDLFNSYVSVVNQTRQSRGKPIATFHLISSQKVGPQAIQALYEVDTHDGKGMRKGNVRIDPLYTRGSPTWAMTVTNSSAPESVYATQNPVMTAMYKTYSQDRSVIGREQQMVMDGIAAASARSRADAAAADARRESSSAAFDQHMDDIDRSSKSFQNYQLDRSQLQDNYNNTRGTVNALSADALVAADPDRFQIITRPDFIKGVDY